MPENSGHVEMANRTFFFLMDLEVEISAWFHILKIISNSVSFQLEPVQIEI